MTRITSSAQTPSIDAPTLWRVKHLTAKLQIGKSTLWRWVGEGRFPQPVRFGRVTVWRDADVKTWLDSLTA